MKKLSTLVCFMIAGGFAYAQQMKSVGPANPANVNLKQSAIQEKRGLEVNPVQSSRAIIWSDDFSTPANWTMTNTSNPAQDFVIGTSLPSTLTAQGFDAAINSTSGGNFAYIDSDGAGQTATQDAYIYTTNSIDLSTNLSVEMVFTNYHRRYLETHYVVVSTDGGATWTEIEVNGDYPTSTTSPNAEDVSVNLTCIAGGQSNVKIGFRYVGAWDWFWTIDDVILQDASANEISLTGANFNATTLTVYGQNAKYTIFPSTEVMGMAFTGYLNNRGSDPQSNVTLDVNVIDPSNVVAFTGSSAGVSLGVCSNTSMQDSVMTYTASGALGEYDIAYLANYGNILMDGTPSDNMDTLQFWIDDMTYARDDNTYRTSGLWNGAGNPYEIGNIFQINANKTLWSIDVALTGNTDAGVLMCAKLYEVDPSSGDFLLVAETCGSSNEVEVATSDLSTTGTINLVHNFFDGGVALTAGTEYLAVINHYGGAEELVMMQGGTGADTTTVFILDTDATWYYMTSVPVIRMGFDQSVGVTELPASSLSVSQNVPNPANGNTRINYSIENASEVSIQVVDLTGKVVMNESYGKKAAGTHSITVDVANLAVGVYYYTVNAGGVTATKKMVITE